MKIVECVPNFSEGQDMAKIKQITDVIESCSGVTLLDVDPGADTNRTVVTFVGSPDDVAEAAFQCVKKASEILDMSTHHGAHPRFGATDVCPFVPVKDMTIAECAEIAKVVGKRIGDELGIPVYLYEAAASSPERQNLAVVRKGEYEGLRERFTQPGGLMPDFGPHEFNEKSGAIAVGAREFLIAYNITLNTRDKALATDIAFELREKGRVARKGGDGKVYGKGEMIRYAEGYYPCGNDDAVFSTYEELETYCREKHGYELSHLLDLNDVPRDKMIGRAVYRAGLFSHCKAIGWYVDQYDRAQISINLTDYHVTPPHVVLEKARELAAERGLVVTGSEIVGVVPAQALIEAGHYYLAKQGKTPGVPVMDAIKTAVYSMGLADVAPFDIDAKVIGLPTHADGPLVSMTTADLVDEVSRDTPAPGGGSIAALSGALAAALASMVAGLTQGKATDAETDQLLTNVSVKAQDVKDQLVAAVDADTDAFNAYMDARRMPNGTPEEKAAREKAEQDGLKEAVEVPFRTAELSYEAMQLADQVAHHGNPASITDGAVGVECGFAGVRGGIWNVMINLKDIHDDAFIADMRHRCDELLAKARELRDANGEFVDGKLVASLQH